MWFYKLFMSFTCMTNYSRYGDSYSSPMLSPTLCDCFVESSYPDISLSISKREYLLAQIRQKDAIIESLLKQVSYDLLSD